MLSVSDCLTHRITTEVVIMLEVFIITPGPNSRLNGNVTVIGHSIVIHSVITRNIIMLYYCIVLFKGTSVV